jgi:hypothetical protein
VARTKPRWSRECPCERGGGEAKRHERKLTRRAASLCPDHRPLGSQDWPEGEKPPPGYFDHQTASNFGASDSSEAAAAGKHGATRPGEQVGGGGGSADPADEPASGARYKSIPGLEQEVQFLNTYGQQMMDDVLEETPWTAALFELDGMCILDDDYDDDRATDEGTDESFDDEEPAKKKAKVWENPLTGKKKVRPLGWGFPFTCGSKVVVLTRRDRAAVGLGVR